MDEPPTDAPTEPSEAPEPNAARRYEPGLIGRAPPASLGLLIFGFGTAAGFLIAFSGLDLLRDASGVVLLVFLVLLMFIGALGLVLFVFRKPLWRRLFGIAETQLELFSTPISEVVRGLIDQQPQTAIAAARDLVHMGLARYAWLATRRWIIGSLTALIAAMAALAGTAMLFKQNQLLQAQNMRIDIQIAQIEKQILLDTYTVQLAEAARNAQLVVEITAIAAELGQAMDVAMQAFGVPETGKGTRTVDGSTPLIDPLQDLDLSLVMRIASASRATKPYRFLKVGVLPEDQNAIMRAAIARRSDLPATLAQLSVGMQWQPEQDEIGLVDRPASPERGQLLLALTQSGVREMEILSFFGMDLSYAYAPGIRLFMTSFQVGQLSYADLSFATIMEADFSGASLYNARFHKAFLRDTTFASVPGADVKAPFSHDIDYYNTGLTGADFQGAIIRRCDFRRIFGLAARFDGAALFQPDFRDAGISAATFRGTAIFGARFDGADLRSVDFDGAVVAGADFLDRLAADAAPGSFRKERFALEEIDITEAMNLTSLYNFSSTEEVLEQVANKGLYRIKRVQPFEN
ncbi:MAG: pentapeptide repeat-containing protein [Rhodobacteraceae bacterium]|nr:pentapeptide repeat-containing protein [Paracoccaceae bacterium]